MGLLSVLKNSARRGTIVDSVAPSESEATLQVRSRLEKWHLAAPWLQADPHKTCLRSYWGPTRCEQGSAPSVRVALVSSAFRHDTYSALPSKATYNPDNTRACTTSMTLLHR
jgi:hypothetical protein